MQDSIDRTPYISPLGGTIPRRNVSVIDFNLLPSSKLTKFGLIQDQSINQLNFYSANIPGEAKLSGVTAE